MSITDDFLNSSDDEKVEILQDIEFEEVLGKWDLIHTVVENREEYDLARVEALKILELAELPEQEVQRFSNLLIAIINTDPDYDVKNYAVIAARNFINSNESLKALVIQVVTNSSEDIDIRHNAYSAILKITDVAGKRTILEQLAQDGELGKYARKDAAAL